MPVKPNPEFLDPHKAYEHIVVSLQKHRAKSENETAVIGVGGIESLVTFMAANDAYGPDNVLAVTAYNVNSDSRMPAIISEMMTGILGHHCTIDMTRPNQELLQVSIGLRKIEMEQMHFSMNKWQKTELTASLRSTMCRGVAIRHEASYVEAYSLSKILYGWVIPTAFDWNPICDLTHHQVVTIAQRKCPQSELLARQSGLDIWPDGGPFPTAAGFDLFNDDQACSNDQSPFLSGTGLGIHQPEE